MPGTDDPADGGTGVPRPGDPTAAQPDDAVQPDAEETHEPTGLELARSLAASIGARSGRRGDVRPSGQSRRSGRRGRFDPQVSGARPDDRDPQLVGRSLDRLVDAKGWSREINVHTILGRWSVLVGPALAQHTVPEAYTNTVVTVRASSTAWATQLRGLAPTLVARLNSQLGDGTVSRIQVLGPDVPSWKHGRRSVPGRGPRDTYG